MPDIFEYISWRGDLPLENVPVCDADVLIFSRLSYIPFDGAVPKESGGGVTLSAAAEEILRRAGEEESDVRFRKKEDAMLLEALSDAPRYSGILLSGFVNIYDEKSEEQFSAITMSLPDKSTAVVFRGTDGTLVGWKEDFNLSFETEVPAQRDAVSYLESAASASAGALRIYGHSKGGNLSVYSAAFCKSDVRRRVTEVRSLDGPGFNEAVAASEGFLSVRDITKTYLPQSSVIGMLLCHTEGFSVVHSTKTGLFQHNLYSWEIAKNGSFEPYAELTDSSRFTDAAIRKWISGMTTEQRAKFTDAVYNIVTSSDATTLRELWHGKNTLAIIRAAGKTDEETRKTLSEGLRLMRRSLQSSFPEQMELIRKSQSK